MANASLADHKYYVYVHSRLSSGEPFYVGKGHGKRACRASCRGKHWESIVKKDGGLYVSIVVDKLDEELSLLVEMELISKLRYAGAKLANKTDGGDGVSGYRNPNGAHNKGVPCSEEMKARISATMKAKGCLPPIGWNKGLKTSIETIEKRRASLLARWARIKKKPFSQETRAKMRVAKLGKPLTDEHKSKLSEALKANKYKRTIPNMKGFVHSAETRAKMSASSKGRIPYNKGVSATEEERNRLIFISRNMPRPPLSEETKRKIGAAHKGRVVSLESREKSRKSHYIPVQCVETGEIFESALAAALSLGLKQKTQITACCTGRLRHVRGLTFKHFRATNG